MSIAARRSHHCTSCYHGLFSCLLVFVCLSAFSQSVCGSALASSGEHEEAALVTFFNHTFSRREFTSLQQQTDSLFSDGKWVNAYSIHGYKPMYYHQCIWTHQFLLKYILNDCYESEAHRGYRWYWKPSKKNLKGWYPDAMCKMINGRNIMFVGDSLNEQMFYVLMSSMMAHVLIPKDQHNNTQYIDAKRKEVVDRCENFCPYNAATCNGPVKVECGDLPSFHVSFQRDDHLRLYEESEQKKTLSPWIRALESNDIDLLILNTGSHYLPNEETLRNVNESLTYIETHPKYKDKVSIVYRDTSPGHPNCKDSFRTLPLLEPMDTTFMEKEKPHYHLGH
jgi:hypothetical protein